MVGEKPVRFPNPLAFGSQAGTLSRKSLLGTCETKAWSIERKIGGREEVGRWGGRGGVKTVAGETAARKKQWLHSGSAIIMMMKNVKIKSGKTSSN